ncbi:LexA family protein [Ureibacillus sp. FSL K6-0165]|uniref:LexA family protein n=1 Tax=Ureibacillus sp. FSL K6-0165 TaxID=2954606 RepID=UPI0030FB304F
MERGEKLEFYMNKKGLTPRSLSRESGVAYTTIRSMLENNLKNSSIDNVIKLCSALEIKVEDLLEDENFSKQVNYVSIPSRDYHYFPIGVSAGLPINVEPIGTAETITIPDELLGKWAGNKDIYFTRVNGESMNKVIPHGSLIAVKQIEVENLKNGDIVVYSNGHDYAVKRFYQTEDKFIFRPESYDPVFTDYIIEKVDSEELRLHGKVIAYIVNLD